SPALALHPAIDGWIALVRRADGSVATHRSPAPALGPQARFQALVEAARADLAGTDTLRVFAYGELASVDAHALLLAGEPLLARTVVTYPMGLPDASTANGTSAAIVGDARRDLPAARDEAQLVARALHARNWSTELLLGEDASHARVSDALARA